MPPIPLGRRVRDAERVIGTVTDEMSALVSLVAGDDDQGSVRPRIAIEALVEAAGKVASDDLPILSMLVHGTSPADIAKVLGIGERELAGRRRRMHAVLVGGARVPR